MYRNTPYKNYAQIQEALRKKTAVLRIARGKYTVLLQRFGQGRPSVVLAFLLQFILPAAFVVGWFLLFGAVYTLNAGVLTFRGSLFLGVVE